MDQASKPKVGNRASITTVEQRAGKVCAACHGEINFSARTPRSSIVANIYTEDPDSSQPTWRETASLHPVCAFALGEVIGGDIANLGGNQLANEASKESQHPKPSTAPQQALEFGRSLIGNPGS